MQIVNDFLNTSPFDLYELSLFHLVVKHHSFTKAAQAAGLTQSAITRQIQGMEKSLGISLLERTTRSVRLTKAGEFLFQNSAKLLGDVDQSLRRLKEDFANARKEVRIGVSRSVALAYMPGFFHANVRHVSGVGYQVSYQPSEEILSALEMNELDLGFCVRRPGCPRPFASRTISRMLSRWPHQRNWHHNMPRFPKPGLQNMRGSINSSGWRLIKRQIPVNNCINGCRART